MRWQVTLAVRAPGVRWVEWRSTLIEAINLDEAQTLGRAALVADGEALVAIRVKLDLLRDVEAVADDFGEDSIDRGLTRRGRALPARATPVSDA